MAPDRLDYQKLDVYQRSIDFLALVVRIAKVLPNAERELRDQLKRAAMSIPLNIAEGYGKTSAVDRARFHAIARGSAMECGAILDVCTTTGLLAQEDAASGNELVFRLVSMLTKMCR